MKKMLDHMADSAKKAKQELLEQQSRPKRTPREVLSTKRFPENGPQIPRFLFNNNRNAQPKPHPQSSEVDLKHERSLKKPMVYDDEERAHQMKAMFSRNFSDRRRSNGIVIKEPKSGKDSSPEFSGKSKHNDDDHTGKNDQCMKLPNSKPGKIENKRKWKKFADCGNAKARPKLEPLPEDVQKKIKEKAETEGEDDLKIVLVIQKVLQVSDISRQQNRITIPLARLENPFLTWREEQWLEEKNGSHTNHMTVPIIEPSGRVRSLNLRRWNIGKNSVSYVLNGDWFEVVELNRLGEGRTVQLWAFRLREELNLALVIVPGEDEADELEDEDDDEYDGGMETDVRDEVGGSSCSSGSEGENGTPPKSEDSESHG